MKDNLYRKPYAEKIAKEIIDKYDLEKNQEIIEPGKIRENIIFAISGKWGEGKTVLLHLIEKPLIDAGFQIVCFNPWKYSQEDITLKRAFLQTVKVGLGSSINMDDLYYDRSKTLFDWQLLALILVDFFILGIWLPSIIQHLSINYWFQIFINSKLGQILTSVTLITAGIKALSFNRRAANVSTAEEFEQKFKELLKGKEKIVIFIDDLDRCNSKTVKIILDALKTFFQHPECSYVITGDHTVIERYAAEDLNLGENFRDSEKLQEGRRFLKKLFDVYWRLPLATKKQFTNFTDSEIKESKIKFSDPQVENFKSFLFNDELFERNPRQVKRFITKLRFALDTIELQIKDLTDDSSETKLLKESLTKILYNPDLLAKILLIEEFFFSIYEKLVLHPEELANHEKELRRGVNAQNLKIVDKPVSMILQGAQNDIEKYASLIRSSPKFTDANDSTIFEVADFISFSGSTGLPSQMGPDPSKFAEYLKTGQAVTQLGKILESGTPKDKNIMFAQEALNLFDATQDQEKFNCIFESVKIAQNVSEWAQKLPDWADRLVTLPRENKIELIKFFIPTALKQNPAALMIIKTKDPELLSLLAEVLNKPLIEGISLEAKTVLKDIIKFNVQGPEIRLRSVQSYVDLTNDAEIIEEIKKYLSEPDNCKIYFEMFKTLSISSGSLVDLTKESLIKIFDKPGNALWINANKDLLKEFGLFRKAQDNVLALSMKPENLVTAVEQFSQLEFNEDDKKQLFDNIVAIAKSSSSLEAINNSTIATFLDKNTRIELFKIFILAFSDQKNDLNKRAEIADILLKNAILWTEFAQDDIYQELKRINALKILKTSVLSEKRKAILDSWSWVDNTTFKILKATYGTHPDKIIEITEQLNKAIINDKLNIQLTNTIAGDPDPGVAKKGIIKYLFSSGELEKEYIEGGQIVLP